MVNTRSNALDGVRAICILSILVAHCGFLQNAGGMGNATFFTLSGFFCSVPFVLDNPEKKYTDYREVIKYYINKLCRIIPVFWITLWGAHYAMDYFDRVSLVNNMIFLDNWGHLWFLQQEMFMYLIVPFVMIGMYIIKKNDKNKYNDVLCGIILLLIGGGTRILLTEDIIYLSANGAHQPIRLYMFFTGMATGYFYRAYLKCEVNLSKNKIVQIFTTIYNVFFLSLFVVPFLTYVELGLDYHENYHLYSILSAIGIFSLLATPNNFVARIVGSKIMAYIGKISFSVYLNHMFILLYFNLIGTIQKVFLTIVLSIGCAIITYYVIEKPSIILGKTRSIKSVISYYKDLL